jgi:hypothetical protein
VNSFFFLMKNMAKSLVFFFYRKTNAVNWFHSYCSREYK